MASIGNIEILLTAFPVMAAMFLNFVNTPDTVSLGGANIVR